MITHRHGQHAYHEHSDEDYAAHHLAVQRPLDGEVVAGAMGPAVVTPPLAGTVHQVSGQAAAGSSLEQAVPQAEVLHEIFDLEGTVNVVLSGDGRRVWVCHLSPGRQMATIVRAKVAGVVLDDQRPLAAEPVLARSLLGQLLELCGDGTLTVTRGVFREELARIKAEAAQIGVTP